MVGKLGVTRCAHISRRKFDIMFDCSVADIPTTKTVQIEHVNRNTERRYFNLFTDLIRQDALKERQQAQLSNGGEVDESYFGQNRVRGKRGR